MSLEEVIRDSLVVVKEGRYAYLKTDIVPAGSHFLVARDDDEMTVVTEERQIAGIHVEAETKWFKLLEIRVTAPFVATGFLVLGNLNVVEADTRSSASSNVPRRSMMPHDA